MAASFTPLQPTVGIAHGDLRLVCRSLAMETHFMKLCLVLTLISDAVWNSVVSVATEYRQILRASAQSSPVLWACVWPTTSGWAVVAPKCFHFTITALTVDRDSSSRAEILQTDLLERWHLMTVPHWKSLSYSVWPFCCQCLSMEIVWPCAQFYTPVSSRCGWNSRIH